MKTHTFTIAAADFPFLMEAITLRAMSLQDALRQQVYQQTVQEKPSTITLDAPVAKIEVTEKPKKSKAKPSLQARRAALKELLKTKEGRALSIAEIARRTGVSYVTARKAFITKGKN